MSLTTPQTTRPLQRACYAKAKAEPAFRFYTLYDKIYRKDVLCHAWGCCRANGGTFGVDGESFAQIEAAGVEAWLARLAEELKTKTYRPQAAGRAAGVHSQTGRPRATVGHTDDQRSGGADGQCHRAGADL